MRKFILYNLTLIIVIIITAFLLNNIYDAVYLNSKPRNKISLLVMDQHKPSEYVFIGSSRVENSINSTIVEEMTGKSTINLGLQGAKMSDYELIIRLLNESKKTPNQIFLQIDYVYNFQAQSKQVNTAAIPFISSNKIVKEHFLKYNSDNYSNYLNIPFYKYLVNDFKIGFREFCLTLTQRGSKHDLNNGFYPLYGNQEQKSASLPIEVAKHNESFDSILEISKNQNYQLDFFFAPYCQNTLNLDYVKKLKTKIPGLYDFSRSIADDDFFQNCSHLNYKGANAFTEIFVNQVILKK